MSRLPPPQGVFTLSASIEINAPPDVVFGILTDFPSYHLWNTFVPNLYFIDPKTGAEIKPFSPENFQLDAPLEMKVIMDPLKPDSITTTKVHISSWKAGEEVGWTAAPGVPGWMLSAVRKQFVWQREDGVTVYETQENFNGGLAYVVKNLYLNQLQGGFDAVAKGLKKYAEKKGIIADTVSTSIEINAPPDVVFGILTDLSSYNLWNTFVPNIYFTNPKTGAELKEKLEFHLNAPLEMKVIMDPLKPDSITTTKERISSFKAGEEVGWRFAAPGVPGWMLSAERKQFVWRREDGVTVYETQENFSGVLAYVVKSLLLKQLQGGFEAVAKGLKEYAEKKADATAETAA